MKHIVLKDIDGVTWKVWVRVWYQHKIKTADDLWNLKQKAADEQRVKGRERLADEIEKQTFMRWCKDSGILSKKTRI